MSSSPTPPAGGEPSGPSFAEENAMRVASESITHYDQAADVYHCSYGPPAPAATIHDVERGLLVRIDPHTRQVIGFSIPEFKRWYEENAGEDGSFEVDLPPVWPEGEGEAAEG